MVGWLAGWLAGLPDLFRCGKRALLATCEGGVGAGGWDRIPSFAGRRRERGLRRGVGCTFRALRPRGREWRSRRRPEVGLVMAFGDLGMGAITNIPLSIGSPNFSQCIEVHIDFTSSRLAIWHHMLSAGASSPTRLAGSQVEGRLQYRLPTSR